ncbi:MAG: transcriptional regulator, partial [Rhodobacter sp.]|nr:transcriptional regulator [Rhodobacter sp.]
MKYIKDALDNHRDDPTTLAWAGHTIAYLGHQRETGVHALERALQLNPNSAAALRSIGWVSNYIGDANRAIESFDALRRLSPLDPVTYATYSGLGAAYSIAGRLEEAVKALEHSRALSVDFTSTLLDLVGSYVALGRDDDAQAAGDKLRTRQPALTIALFRAT